MTVMKILTPADGPLKAGAYRMPPARYHADPCEQPSLSSGLLRLLLDSSPLHVWSVHPRLGAADRTPASRKMDVGSVAHKMVLGAGNNITIIDADSYRTKAAQEQRDLATAAGTIPCLTDDYAKAEAVAAPLRDALEAYMGCPIADCHRELVVLWEEGGAWRRAMLDCVSPDFLKVADLKTTPGSAAPGACIGKMYDGGEIQAGWYLRAMDAIDEANAGRRTFGFIFGETAAPFCVSPPLELSEGGLTIARSKIDIGCALFDSCLRANLWPGYPQDARIVEPPSWLGMQWGARMETDETLNPIQEHA